MLNTTHILVVGTSTQKRCRRLTRIAAFVIFGAVSSARACVRASRDTSSSSVFKGENEEKDDGLVVDTERGENWLFALLWSLSARSAAAAAAADAAAADASPARRGANAPYLCVCVVCVCVCVCVCVFV